MQKKHLLSLLRQDYPALIFKTDEAFRWSPESSTIFYNFSLPQSNATLLHEVAHAVLGHNTHSSLDIELIKKERAAWDYTLHVLGPKYKIAIENDIAEEALDTYRYWLHKRSTCPECNITAFQTKTGTYACPACRCQWRANDARKGNLRRRKTQKRA